MANAATIAGLAFSNAFVGVNHALAHAFGARFGVAHGRANASSCPTCSATTRRSPRKFMPSPGDSRYVAPPKYAQMAWMLALGAREAGAATRLFARVDAAAPRRRHAAPREAAAIDDSRPCSRCPSSPWRLRRPSMRTNPRMPLVSELRDLLEAGYAGR